jgi:hypothetical protein
MLNSNTLKMCSLKSNIHTKIEFVYYDNYLLNIYLNFVGYVELKVFFKNFATFCPSRELY